MRERTHFYQKELVQNAFIGFLLDLGNIMLSKKDRLIRPTLSRKEELFEQFLQLLFEHCKEQHVVTFYAERLFITPQYLSLILKELTGKSANKWIDDALIVEAKIPTSRLLENSLRNIWEFLRWSTVNPEAGGTPFFSYLLLNLYQLINSEIP